MNDNPATFTTFGPTPGRPSEESVYRWAVGPYGYWFYEVIGEHKTKGEIVEPRFRVKQYLDHHSDPYDDLTVVEFGLNRYLRVIFLEEGFSKFPLNESLRPMKKKIRDVEVLEGKIDAYHTVVKRLEMEGLR